MSQRVASNLNDMHYGEMLFAKIKPDLNNIICVALTWILH